MHITSAEDTIHNICHPIRAKTTQQLGEKPQKF